MDVPDLMAALATQIARIPGLNGRAYYPARVLVEKSPTVMIRQSNEQPTTYEKARLGLQVVRASIDVVILVAPTENNDRPRDEAKIDTLISPILDLFDASASGGSVNDRLPGLDGHVDAVWHTATIKRGVLPWAGTECYAAVITLDSVFKRSPLTITLEVTP